MIGVRGVRTVPVDLLTRPPWQGPCAGHHTDESGAEVLIVRYGPGACSTLCDDCEARLVRNNRPGDQNPRQL